MKRVPFLLAVTVMAASPALAQQVPADRVVGTPGAVPATPDAPQAPLTVQQTGSNYLDTYVNWRSYGELMELVRKAREAEASAAEAKSKKLAAISGAPAAPAPIVSGQQSFLGGSPTSGGDSTMFMGSAAAPVQAAVAPPPAKPAPAKPAPATDVASEPAEAQKPRPPAFQPVLLGIKGSRAEGYFAEIQVDPGRTATIYPGDPVLVGGVRYEAAHVEADLVLLKNGKKSLPLMLRNAPPRHVSSGDDVIRRAATH